MWIALAGVSMAAVPDGIRPVATDLAAPLRYRRHLEATGEPPSDLACDILLPGALMLCFRVWEDGALSWVDASDLARWQETTASLRAHVVARSAEQVNEAPLVGVRGLAARYVQHASGEGWAVAGLLAPEALAARAGGRPVRAALPGQDVLVAWAAGTPELDKVMAVGVRELFDKRPRPLTPRVFQWDGGAWLPFGEAVPAEVGL